MEIKDIKDNVWYFKRLGKTLWIIKKLDNVLFGLKTDNKLFSKREQKEFIRFCDVNNLYPVLVINSSVVDDVIYKEIAISIKYKRSD